MGCHFCGFVTALSNIFLLNLIGVGIGFASIDSLEESSPLEGLGIGTLIYWILTNLIALFTGGMVAGRLAGHADKLMRLHTALSFGAFMHYSRFILSQLPLVVYLSG